MDWILFKLIIIDETGITERQFNRWFDPKLYVDIYITEMIIEQAIIWVNDQ